MNPFSQTIMYFQKGGLVMWPLLICSIIVLSIAVEHFLYYQSVDCGKEFVKKFCSAVENTTTEEAESLVAGNKGQCAQMLARAFQIAGGKTQKEAYLETQSGLFIAKLKDKLDYLSIIVTMSPLLGLLGTIVGMIGTFSVFNLKAGAPLAITGGIGEALIATATGLCVAILSLIFHSYYEHRMDNMITDMEQCFSAYLEAVVRSENK